jgi:hypothetical protein
MRDGWMKKIKGSAIIHTHPNALDGRAIVVTIYGIRFNGDDYATLAEAKAAALTSPHQEPGK